MKKVFLKRGCNLKHGIKRFSILQKNEESDCSTKVYKNFNYQLRQPEQLEKLNDSPEIYITKNFDTKRGTERFSFSVHGAFYVNHDRKLYRVDFQHTLKIQIKWKDNIFSPKKSATLT